ncbi:MAG: hypothetical protein K8S23_07190 [Candidatus Cloacimonetes bacterium]|nr:hypothetical protein [Candidatus Cloacimonadota bacterium]
MEINFKDIINSITRKLRKRKKSKTKDDNSFDILINDVLIDDDKLNKSDNDEPYENNESKCKIIL